MKTVGEGIKFAAVFIVVAVILIAVAMIRAFYLWREQRGDDLPDDLTHDPRLAAAAHELAAAFADDLAPIHSTAIATERL